MALPQHLDVRAGDTYPDNIAVQHQKSLQSPWRAGIVGAVRELTSQYWSPAGVGDFFTQAL